MNLRPEANIDVALAHAPVGGGHLTFLYALATELETRGKKVQILDPSLAGNAFTRAIWEKYRTGYETGSQGGLLQSLYEIGRNNSFVVKQLINLAKWELVDALSDFDGKIVADHAYVATGRGYLIQSDVGTERLYADKKSIVFVPVEESLNQLVNDFHHPRDKTKEVGFFVHRSLINKQRKEERKAKLQEGTAHIGFFGTGASPKQHYEMLEKTILPGLAKAKLFGGETKNGRVKLTVYTWTNETKGKEIEALAREELGLRTVINEDDDPEGNWDVRVMWGETPYDAVMRSVDVAGQIDYIVTMMGERTGWLHDIPGTPLEPIGINVPHDTQYLYKNGIIQPVDQTQNFPEYMEEQLKTGALDILGRMDKGEKIPVEGAQKATEEIIFSR